MKPSVMDLEDLLANINVGLFQTDVYGECIYANKVWSDITGLSSLQSAGYGWLKSIHPEDRPSMFRFTETAMKGATDHRIDCRVKTPQGIVRWVSIHSKPILDEQGQFRGTASTIMDRTTEKLAEKQLLDHKKLIDTYGSEEGLWDWNIETGQVNYSDQFKRMLGFKPHEFGNSIEEWESRLNPADYNEVFTRLYSYFDGRSNAYNSEHRIMKKNGEYLWVADSGKIIERSPSGKPLRIVGTYRDITLKKEAESKLTQSEDKFHSAFSFAAIGMAMFDCAERLTRVNPALCRLLGYEEAELTTKKLSDIILPEDAAMDAGQLEALKRGEISSYQAQKRFTTSGGEVVWIMQTTSLVQDSQGQPAFYIAQLQDITERITYESELIKAKEKAEAATRSQTEFLSMMSHELRTPLNALIGNAELLLADNQNPHIDEELRTVQFSAQNLLSLINDILDYNKIEAGKLDIEKIEFNPRELLTGLMKSHRMKAEEQNNILELHCGKNVPEILVGDPVRLSQVLNNLLSNAIKFTRDGKVKLTVRQLSHDNGRAMLSFTVKDNGVGIPADKHRLIFDRFAQAEQGIARKFGGTGLGLTLVKSILELQQSEIRLESEAGAGATFSFSIGYGIGEKKERTVESLSEVFDLKGMKILVVEDNRLNLVMVSKFISRWSGLADGAENGKIAIEKVKKEDYDLVLMDLQMPEMDGHEATTRIREFNREIPIIALTASATMEIRDKAAMVGMNDFITKPFHPGDFYLKLRRYSRVA